MQKSCKFPTGSSYEGFYNTSMHCMEGFGRYLFPDGSEYRGYFRRGKFHGYGRIQLAPPFRFTFIGDFEDGELMKIHELTYPDGLQLFATVTPSGLNTDEWQYCTEEDRRYPHEICFGIDPVSPINTETRIRPPRDLPPNSYDNEEGIYLPTTGFIARIPVPFHKYRFVSCHNEVKWIKKYCRRAVSISNPVPVEPDNEAGQRIIDTNMRAMSEEGVGARSCPCGPAPMEFMPTRKWCANMFSEVQPNSEQSSSEMDHCTKCSLYTSDSKSSFSNEPLMLDLLGKCDAETSMLKIMDEADSGKIQ